jgi:hypothetical protein
MFDPNPGGARHVVRLNPGGRIIGSIIHIKFVEATLHCLRN